MFGFSKKKQVSMPDLPPPPSPPGMTLPEPMGDIPQIVPKSGPEELPELPVAPTMEPELEEIPAPEMPEAPAPGPEEQLLPTVAEVPTMEPVAPEEREVSVFDKTIPESRETVRRPVGPAFVSVDDYRQILEHSGRVRAKLAESEGFLKRLGEIQAEEEHVFERWRAQLEDVERKLGHVDRVIARAKR